MEKCVLRYLPVIYGTFTIVCVGNKRIWFRNPSKLDSINFIMEICMVNIHEAHNSMVNIYIVAQLTFPSELISWTH